MVVINDSRNGEDHITNNKGSIEVIEEELQKL